MKLCVLGSGSKGNSILIQAGQTRILIDAGFSPRGIKARLAAIAVDPRSIEAMIVTHEHVDHIKGAVGCAKRWDWKVYATGGTVTAAESLASLDVQEMICGKAFSIGDFDLATALTSHDASEPVAVFATDRGNGARAAIVYDLGIITEAVLTGMKGVNLLVLESNHDGEMLRNGPYPAMLRRRIAGSEGHLSNYAAARVARECAHRQLHNVVLAHLSQVNNSVEVATQTMRAALSRTAFRGTITTASQDVPSPTIRLAGGTHSAAGQLSLGI